MAKTMEGRIVVPNSFASVESSGRIDIIGIRAIFILASPTTVVGEGSSRSSIILGRPGPARIGPGVGCNAGQVQGRVEDRGSAATVLLGKPRMGQLLVQARDLVLSLG